MGRGSEFNGRSFEREVQRVARLLWPDGRFSGAKLEDGQERDGVFETAESVHLLECTIDRTVTKARKDSAKLVKLRNKYRRLRQEKNVIIWFVTLDEPTVEQRAAFPEHRQTRVVSYETFRAELVDAHDYLNCRLRYPFGSVRDPETGSAVQELDYIPMDLLATSGDVVSLEEMAEDVLGGEVHVLLGDYGAGKSSTLRELFLRLATAYKKRETIKFPILLNLRDHYAQRDPQEAFERHARQIGYSDPTSLVRAWRAGYVVLLLDGFDEIAAPGWTQSAKKLMQLRHRSMTLIREMLAQSDEGTGVVVAGRRHYFDDQNELRSALGLGSVSVLSLSDFDSEQVESFLKKRGIESQIPDWLPSRPLLLGYLATRGMLDAVLESPSNAAAAIGWNSLLTRIAEREAELDAKIDPMTVRTLMESVGTIARSTSDSLGPITPDQLGQAFRNVCGYAPDAEGMVLLQRLPGLGGYESETGSRIFIDRDLAQAIQGSAVAAFVQSPFESDLVPDDWSECLTGLGLDAMVERSRELGTEQGHFDAALNHTKGHEGSQVLLCELLLFGSRRQFTIRGREFVNTVIVPEVQLSCDDGGLASVEFQDCMISSLEIDFECEQSMLPRFVNCYVAGVVGRTSAQDLPMMNFEDCEFASFDSQAGTTQGILSLGLPPGTSVVLTILKKLFAQRGSGRKESALKRGLDPRHALLVDSCLKLLKRHGFIDVGRAGDMPIWVPRRDKEVRRRARSILSSPNSSRDPLMLEAKQLTN